MTDLEKDRERESESNRLLLLEALSGTDGAGIPDVSAVVNSLADSLEETVIGVKASMLKDESLRAQEAAEAIRQQEELSRQVRAYEMESFSKDEENAVAKLAQGATNEPDRAEAAEVLDPRTQFSPTEGGKEQLDVLFNYSQATDRANGKNRWSNRKRAVDYAMTMTNADEASTCVPASDQESFLSATETDENMRSLEAGLSIWDQPLGGSPTGRCLRCVPMQIASAPLLEQRFSDASRKDKL